MNNYQLYAPTFITGRGSIEFFASLGKKKIGIIRGGRSYNDEVRTKIENAATSTGADVMYLAQIRNEPYIEDIFACMDKVNNFNPI